MAVIRPSEYLKAAQQEFKNLPVESANGVVDVYINSGSGWNVLAIPTTIPARYHARMQKVWTVMVFNILMARTSRNVPFAKWHQMLQNTL